MYLDSGADEQGVDIHFQPAILIVCNCLIGIVLVESMMLRIAANLAVFAAMFGLSCLTAEELSASMVVSGIYSIATVMFIELCCQKISSLVIKIEARVLQQHKDFTEMFNSLQEAIIGVEEGKVKFVNDIGGLLIKEAVQRNRIDKNLEILD